MERPFAESRPLGPFLEGMDSSRADLFILYAMDTSALDGMFQTVEDNINDKLATSHGGMVEGATMIRDSADSVEVKVKLDTPTFTDKHEDEIVDSIETELERTAQTDVKFNTYRYEF
jgi:hypothetical protein